MAIDPRIEAEIESLDQAIGAWRQKIKENGALAGALNANIASAGRAIQRLQQAAAISQDFQNLRNQTRRGTVSFSDLFSEIKRLDKAAEASGSALSEAAMAARQESVVAARNMSYMKAFGDGLQLMVSTVGGLVINNLRDFASELTSGQGATGYFNLGAKLMKNEVTSLTGAVGGVGKIMQDLGTAVVALSPMHWKAFGAALAVGGSAISMLANKSKEMADFSFEILNKQVLKMMASFQASSKAGAIFSEGVTDIQQIANAAGLSIDNMGAAISKNSEQLAIFGGTVAAGAVRMAAVNKQMIALDKNGNSFRQQLGNLGMSIEEQMSTTNDYMELLARTGKLRSKSDEEIARESFEYAKNLKTIQTITGEDAKKMKDRAKRESEQAYVQMQLTKMGGDAGAKFQTVVSRLPESMQRAVGQLALGEPITDPEVLAAMQQSPTLVKTLTDAAAQVRDAGVNNTDFTKNLNAMIADNSEAIKKEITGPGAEGIARANYLLGSYGKATSVITDVMKMGTGAVQGRPGEVSGAQLQKDAQDQVERAAKTTDELTNSIAGAEMKFNQLQATLEKELMPAIKGFSKFVDNSINTTSAFVQSALKMFNIGQPTNTQTNRITETPGGAAIVSPNGVRRRPNPNNQRGAPDERSEAAPPAQVNLSQVDPNVVLPVRADDLVTALADTNRHLQDMNDTLIQIRNQG